MSNPTTGIGFSPTTPAAPSGNQNSVPQGDNGAPLERFSFYTPKATSSLLGVVYPDGTSITVDGTGKISATSSGLYFGSSTARAANGTNVITLGSTPVTSAFWILLNGVELPIGLLSISGAVVTYAGAFAAGDMITAKWVTTNSTPGTITLSTSSVGIRGTGIQAGTASTYTVVWPSGALIGDLAIISVGSTSGSVTIPSGWTSLDSSPGSFYAGATFSKVLTAADIGAGSVVVTAGSGNGSAAIIVFVGATNGIRVTASARAATEPVTVTTSSAPVSADTAVYFGSVDSSSGTNSVSRGTLQRTATGSASAGMLYAETLASSGSVAPVFTYTSTSSSNYQVVVVVETSTGSAGSTPVINPTQIAGGVIQGLTTTGSSGAASLSGGTLNIPVYGGGGANPFPFTIVQEQCYQSGTSNVTSFAITFPQAAASSGNTLFCLIATDGSQSFTTPSGWTVDINQQENNYARFVLMHKTSASDTGVTLTAGSASQFVIYFFELSGSHALDQHSSGGIANAFIVPMPAITPSANSLVFAMACIVAGSGSVGAISYLLPVINPAWGTTFSMCAEVSSGSRVLLGRISTVGASNVSTTPPPLIISNGIGLYTNGGVAYATFSIL